MNCIVWCGSVWATSVEDFARYPEHEAIEISPDGTYLGVTRRNEVNETITIVRLADMKPLTNVSFGSAIDIWDFFFVTDTRLLIQPARRFPGLTDYNAPTGEFIGMDADGKRSELLFGPFAGESGVASRRNKRESVFAAGRLIDYFDADPNKVLIQSIGYGVKGIYNAAYRMDINNGRLNKVASSPVRNGTFVANVDGGIDIVWGSDDEGHRKVFHRSDGGEWRPLFKFDMNEGSLAPVSPAGDGAYIAIDNRDPDTQGVYVWHPNGAIKQLFSHPDVDVNDLEFDFDNRLWLIGFENYFPDYFYPDPEHPLAVAHRKMRAAFPDDDVTFTSYTRDMRQAVALVTGPRNPGVFYVLDTRDNKVTHQLEGRPWLKREDLTETSPVEFTARDGLKIRALLTTPSHDAGSKLPLIVIPHGGPHGIYDVWGFDPEVQLLAANGYAVLQVNFRGSGGRGRGFESAGYGKWGLEMQDDITDAVKWTISDGQVDPNRICIYGGSYGGYAALMGVVRDPDLYRCAVGFAGVYDLPLMFEKGDIQRVESGINFLEMAVGTDEQEMKRRSPAYNADKIKAAVLLIHGKLDERVPIEHAYRMRDALEKVGKPTRLITEGGEGHGFFAEDNRAHLYRELLDFFDDHIGTRGTPH